jgi:hypothetical protein
MYWLKNVEVYMIFDYMKSSYYNFEVIDESMKIIKQEIKYSLSKMVMYLLKIRKKLIIFYWTPIYPISLQYYPIYYLNHQHQHY